MLASLGCHKSNAPRSTPPTLCWFSLVAFFLSSSLSCWDHSTVYSRKITANSVCMRNTYSKMLSYALYKLSHTLSLSLFFFCLRSAPYRCQNKKSNSKTLSLNSHQWRWILKKQQQYILTSQWKGTGNEHRFTDIQCQFRFHRLADRDHASVKTAKSTPSLTS